MKFTFFPSLAIFFLGFSKLLYKIDSAVKGTSWSKGVVKWPPTLSRCQGKQLNQKLRRMLEYNDFNNTLDSLLVPRVPGTKGHERVRKYIVNEMKLLGWHIDEDNFKDQTPKGRKTFTNIIATHNLLACQRLTLACHYDSLYNQEYTFLGATDSAVPCAMLIHAARMLHSPLKEVRKMNQQLTLQLIFFDGEEAFKKWSSKDSLYGSRHLAAKWNEMEAFPPGDASQCSSKEYASYLDRMDVLVLLDLIGTANTTFYSYYPDTFSLYSQLMEIEKRLRSKGLLEADPPGSETKYFDDLRLLALVEDDHIPFKEKGVPILHLIPTPFPDVWHKESDNRENLHHPTINNLNTILRIFITEYLHLDHEDINVLK